MCVCSCVCVCVCVRACVCVELDVKSGTRCCSIKPIAFLSLEITNQVVL